MNPLDILKLLLGGAAQSITLPKINLKNWTVSLDTVRKGPVTSGKVGLKAGDVFWFDAAFSVDGVAHTLHAERPLVGGASTIIFDNAAPVTTGEVAIRKHITGFPPHFKAEIDVHLTGHVYRFDAEIA